MRTSRRRTLVPATKAMLITSKKMVVYLVKTPKATVSYPTRKIVQYLEASERVSTESRALHSLYITIFIYTLNIDPDPVSSKQQPKNQRSVTPVLFR